uniref:Cj0814 family flagellar-dependent secreted protein n=1 Tax=Campylobacter cuniculorum TaxID=374106 RepID=UPI0023F13C01
TNQAVSMAYGYGVDSQGYMTSDFNKAAGLPEDFKIHKSTLEEIERAAENSPGTSNDKKFLGVDKYYTNIDMADTIKQYYNVFSSALDKSFPSDKTSFSEADINSMPSGYAINFHDAPYNNYNVFIQLAGDWSEATISNVYQTPELLKEANDIYQGLGGIIKGIQGETLGLSLEELKETYTNGGNDWEFNPDMSVYSKNEKGEYPKEALFMSFLKSQEGKVLYSPNNKLNPKVEAYNTAMAKESFYGSHVNIDDIMTGKVDFTNLFKHYVEKDDGQYSSTFGFLYAYENGMSKDSMLGNKALDSQIKNAIANGWRPSSDSINSYTNELMDRLNNLINQTRA